MWGGWLAAGLSNSGVSAGSKSSVRGAAPPFGELGQCRRSTTGGFVRELSSGAFLCPTGRPLELINCSCAPNSQSRALNPLATPLPTLLPTFASSGLAQRQQLQMGRPVGHRLTELLLAPVGWQAC